MFTPHANEDYSEPLSGIRQKTLVHGERTLMVEFHLEKGSVLPNHSHPYEQTGFLVKGHIRVKIGDTEYDAHAGDSWCIPANAMHGAEVLEDSVAIEVFSPVREDYLPKDTTGKRDSADAVANWILRYYAPESVPEVLSVLAEYGRESWHREPDRVKRDAIIVSRGSLEALRKTINLAMTDYRDVLIGESVDPWLVHQLRKYGE